MISETLLRGVSRILEVFQEKRRFHRYFRRQIGVSEPEVFRRAARKFQMVSRVSGASKRILGILGS